MLFENGSDVMSIFIPTILKYINVYDEIESVVPTDATKAIPLPVWTGPEGSRRLRLCKNVYSRTGHRRKYGACAFYAR